MDVVDVWHIGLDQPPDRGAALAGLLGAAETSRLRAYRDAARRADFAIAHGALRLILGARLATPPESLVLRTGRWGKPELADGAARFSLSHSGRVALLAVTGRRDVGVDVELATGRPVEAMAARFFPAEESALVAAAGPAERTAAYLRLWVRKEACVKAAGARLVEGLGLRVARPGGGRADGLSLVVDPTGRLPGPWSVRDLPAPPGHAAAVAVAGAAPYRLAHHRWPAAESRRPAG